MQLSDYWYTCLYGFGRGAGVTLLTCPLDNLKINLQGQKQPLSYMATLKGMNNFYGGLSAQLAKIALKQPYCWPIINNLPAKLPFSRRQNQVVTGVVLGTADSMMGTPLERLRFALLYGKKKDFSWRGFAVLWFKLSTLWSVFLERQEYYRSKEQDKNIPLQRLLWMGAKTTIWASMAAAPFDVLNTLTQTQDLTLRKSLEIAKQLTLARYYRGLPLSVIVMFTHNSSSVILYDRLQSSHDHPNRQSIFMRLRIYLFTQGRESSTLTTKKH